MALQDNGFFTWGPNGQRLTPEQVSMLRALEARKQLQGVDTSPVGHWTQGAARVVDALGGVLRERRLNAADAANRTEDTALAAPLLQALTGGQSASMPMPGAAGEVAATSPAPQATVPQTADADYIRNGLIQRGFSPQVSDAFLANFQDESGLNAGINEANPTVPGSRGGFGLYQLTGPRRTAYEAFAKERGVPVNNVDAQLDFLKYETQGPEAQAASTFLNAPDTATAAQGIVNNFLRPAPEHRAARSAAYAGLPTVQTAPVAPVEVAALGSPQTATDAIAAQSPMPQAVDQSVTTAYAPQQAAPALPPATEVASPPAVAAQPPVQVAQAQQAQFPQVPQVAPQALAAAIQAVNSPYASPQTKALASALIQRQQAAQQAQQEQATWLARQQYEAQQQAADPLRQLQIQEAQRKVGQRPTQVVDKRLLQQDEKGNWVDVTPAGQAGAGEPLFSGNSGEAQTANYMVKTGQWTQDQAANYLGGKVITDPASGAMSFVPANALAGGQQPQAAQQQPYVDLFGENPAPQSSPMATPQPSSVPQANEAPSGMAPGSVALTGSKPPAKLTESEQRNRSLFNNTKNDYPVVIQNFDALTNPTDQIIGKLPLSDYVTTPQYQQAFNGLKNIIANSIYSTSGASAPIQEVEAQANLLMPKPGESKESLADKRRRIRDKVNSIGTAGGLGEADLFKDETAQAAPKARAVNYSTGEVKEWNGKEWVTVNE
jgi:hypothetical protein